MDTKEIITPYLLAEEKLLWSGKSNGRINNKGMRGAGNASTTIFGVFFAGFAVFWMAMAASAGGGAFWLFGLPFLFVGLYIAFFAQLIRKKRLESMVYGITDKRIIFVYNGNVKSRDISTLDNVTLTMGENGRGWISLCNNVVYYGSNYRRSNTYTNNYLWDNSIDDIDNASEVYNLIMDAKHKADKGVFNPPSGAVYTDFSENGSTVTRRDSGRYNSPTKAANQQTYNSNQYNRNNLNNTSARSFNESDDSFNENSSSFNRNASNNTRAYSFNENSNSFNKNDSSINKNGNSINQNTNSSSLNNNTYESDTDKNITDKPDYSKPDYSHSPYNDENKKG